MMERHYVFFLVGLCVLIGFAFSLRALTNETPNEITVWERV